MDQGPGNRRHGRHVAASLMSVLIAGGMLSGCGSSTSSGARGAISEFDADLSRHDDAAACRLLGSAPQAVLVDADARHTPTTTCAEAMLSPGTRRTLSAFAIPASRVGATTISGQGSGVELVQSDKPLPVTYTLQRVRGRWIIEEF